MRKWPSISFVDDLSRLELMLQRMTCAKLQINFDELETYAGEMFNDYLQIRREISREIKKGFPLTGIPRKNELLLFYLIRRVKPRLVVETGVANGVSSYFILRALNANQSGRLLSIDLPSRLDYSKEKDVGWVVPNELRFRWDLRLGNSMDILERFEGTPEIFYHDSDHSYDVMMNEFEWARTHKARYVVSDDVRWNKAWDDFVGVHGICHGEHDMGFAVML